MDDENLSPEDLKKHIEALQRNTDAIFSLSGAVGKKQDDDKTKQSKVVAAADALASGLSKAHNRIDYAASDLSGVFKSLSGSAEEMLGAFHSIIRNFIGGAIVSEIIKTGTDLAKTYKSLSNVGQTFNGSMVEMMNATADAGLPLGEFARMLEHNSTVAAALTQQTGASKTSLGELAKSVRDNTREFGFYGMSLSQIDDLTGSYTETLRLQGRLGKQSASDTSKNVASFAEDISNFAKITGKDREQIAKTSMEAMHDVAYATSHFTDAQDVASKRAISWLASMPGSAGGELSKMLAQTIGYGNAMFTDQFQDFRQVAGGQFLGIMDDMAAKVKKGSFTDNDIGNFYGQIQQFREQNEESLRIQAMSNGPNAAAAKHILTMLNETKGMSKEAFVAHKKEQDEMGKTTLMFAKLEESLGILSSHFTKGLFSVFPELDQKVNDGKPLFEEFYKQIEEVGTTFGGFIKSIIEHKEAIIKGFEGFVDVVTNVIIPMASKVGSVLGWVADKATDFFNLFSPKTQEGIAGFTIGFVILNKVLKSLFGTGLLGGVARFFSFFKNGFKFGEVKINARNVVVNGLGGGGGLSDLTGPHGKPPKEPLGGAGTPPKKGFWGKVKGLFSKSAGLAEGAALEAGNLASAAKPATIVEEAVSAAKPAAAVAEAVAEAAPAVVKEASMATRIGAGLAEFGSKIGLSKAVGFLGKAAEKTGVLVGKLTPEVGGVVMAASAASRLAEGDRVGAAIDAAGSVGSFASPTGVGYAASVGATALNGTRDIVDLFGGREKFDHWFGLDKVNSALGGTNPAEEKQEEKPATPKDDFKNNPYKNLEGDDLKSKYDEVTGELEKLKDSQGGWKDMLNKLDTSNVILAQMQFLQKEQTEMEAVANKKKIELSKKQVSATQETANNLK